MDSERRQTAELRNLLSSSVQEKLTAEGERERLELEIQRLKEQLKWHQEQLSSTKEASIRSQTPELPTAHVETRLNPMERNKDECMDQVTGLHLHWQGHLICSRFICEIILRTVIKMTEIGAVDASQILKLLVDGDQHQGEFLCQSNMWFIRVCDLCS